jgi:uncharacterized RDD family membrane protein YckC
MPNSGVPNYGVPSYGMPTGVGSPPTNYAGWFQRVVATIIDGIIGALFALPGFVVLLAGPTEIAPCTINGEAYLCEQPTDSTLGIAVLLYIVGAVVYLVLYCRLLGKGATWGRKAMGYRILDAQSGQPIGTGRAVGRFFARILDGIPCYLGYLWPLWDAENRTFSDMVVGTRAIKNS